MAAVIEKFAQALGTLPEYAGWTPDKIAVDARAAFLSGDAETSDKFVSALTKLPEYRGRSTDWIRGDVSRVFGTPSGGDAVNRVSTGLLGNAVGEEAAPRVVSKERLRRDYVEGKAFAPKAELPELPRMERPAMESAPALSTSYLSPANQASVLRRSVPETPGSAAMEEMPASSTSYLSPANLAAVRRMEDRANRAAQPLPSAPPEAQLRQGRGRPAEGGYVPTASMAFDPVDTKDALSDEDYRRLSLNDGQFGAVIEAGRGAAADVDRAGAYMDKRVGDLEGRNALDLDMESVARGELVARRFPGELNAWYAKEMRNPVTRLPKAVTDKLDQREREDLWSYVSAEKAGLRRVRAERMGEKAAEKIRSAEEKSPLWLEADKLQRRFEKVRDKDPSIVKSFKTGDLGGLADILVFKAAVSDYAGGEDKYLSQALNFQNAVREESGADNEVIGGKGFVSRAVYGAADMLPMMGRGAALSAVPGIGGLLGTSLWAAQGAGDIISQVVAAGGSAKDALPLAVTGGIGYALIEKAQAGHALNSGLSEAAKGAVWKRVLRWAGEKGWDWVKENAEEVFQDIFTDAEVGKILGEQGIKYEPAPLGERIKETLRGTMGPMGLLNLIGGGKAAGKQALRIARDPSYGEGLAQETRRDRENALADRRAKIDFKAMDAGTYEGTPENVKKRAAELRETFTAAGFGDAEWVDFNALARADIEREAEDRRKTQGNGATGAADGSGSGLGLPEAENAPRSGFRENSGEAAEESLPAEGANEKRERFEAMESPEVSSEDVRKIPRGKGYVRRVIDWVQSKNIFGQHKNTYTGWDDIIVSKTAVKSVVKHDGKDVKVALLEKVPTLIRDGIYLEPTSKNNQGLISHIFAAKATIDGVPYAVSYVVREDVNGRRYYDHSLTKIEALDRVDDQAPRPWLVRTSHAEDNIDRERQGSPRQTGPDVNPVTTGTSSSQRFSSGNNIVTDESQKRMTADNPRSEGMPAGEESSINILKNHLGVNTRDKNISAVAKSATAADRTEGGDPRFSIGRPRKQGQGGGKDYERESQGRPSGGRAEGEGEGAPGRASGEEGVGEPFEQGVREGGDIARGGGAVQASESGADGRGGGRGGRGGREQGEDRGGSEADAAVGFGSAVEAGVPAEDLKKFPNASKRAREEWVHRGTRSAFFKRWFGDWEKDPEGASQMVDRAGQPKVFHHRSSNKFNKFDIGRAGSGNDVGWLGQGFYFYGVEEESHGYGKNAYDVYLNIRNPYYATREDMERLSEANDPEASKEFTESLKDEGYDGVYYNGDLREEAVAFYPEQIKLAEGNRGTFDAGNPDIRFAMKSGKAARQGFVDEFDKWDGKRKTTFTVGTTSKPLQSIGVRDKKIIWHSGKIEEILNKHKGMTRDIIKQVPDILENPIVVLKSKNADSRLVIFGEIYDTAGAPVTAILELHPTGSSGKVLDINVIASAYGKTGNPAAFIRDSEVLYIDSDKERADNWFQGIRLQLPSYKTGYGPIGKITYSGDKINISGVPFSRLSEVDSGREGLSPITSPRADVYPGYTSETLGSHPATSNNIGDSASEVNTQSKKSSERLVEGDGRSESRRDGAAVPSMREALSRVPEDVQRRLGSLWDDATRTPKIDTKLYKKTNIGRTSDRLNAAIGKALGRKVNILVQAITLEQAQHIDERHGRGESDAGQIPVTKEVFMLMPDVLDNFNSVRRGNVTPGRESVQISKQYSDGTVVIADAVIDDFKLEVKSMWIKKPTEVRRHQASRAGSGSLLNSATFHDKQGSDLRGLNGDGIESAHDDNIGDSAPEVNTRSKKTSKTSGAINRAPTEGDFAPVSKEAWERLLALLERTGLAKGVVTDAAEMRRYLERRFGKDGAARFMNVWHGSPHAFDKFSSAKIGTGEGNQAYGHGLYFTDLKEIAETYAPKSTKRIIIDGKDIVPQYRGTIAEDLAAHVDFNGGDLDKTREYLEKQVTSFTKNAAAAEALADVRHFQGRANYYKAALEFLDRKRKDIAVETRDRNLYNVKIHGDKTVDELNFLRWDKGPTKEQVAAILSQSTKEGVGRYESEALISGYDDGKDIYAHLGRVIGAGDRGKSVSEFLLRAGIDGIQYPTGYQSKGSHEDSYNYVVFDDSVIEIAEHIRFMSTPMGEVYGFATEDGKIYLDPERMNANTPIHEYAHLWIDAVRKGNKPLYDRLMTALNGSDVLDEVMNDPSYRHLSGNKNGQREEALARAIAAEGEIAFARDSKGTAAARFRAALRDLWRWVTERLGVAGRGGLSGADADRVGGMTLEELVGGAARELLGGRRVGGGDYIRGVGEGAGKQEQESRAEMYQKGMEYKDAQRKLHGLLGEANEVILENDNDGEEARLSKSSIGKLMSNAAVKKSMDNGFTREQHYAAASDIDNLFKNAVKVLSHADREGNRDVVAMHRFAAPLFGDNVAYITVKETTEHGKRMYTVEVMEIGKLEGMLEEAESGSATFPASNFPKKDNIEKLAGMLKELYDASHLGSFPLARASLNVEKGDRAETGTRESETTAGNPPESPNSIYNILKKHLGVNTEAKKSLKGDHSQRASIYEDNIKEPPPPYVGVSPTGTEGGAGSSPTTDKILHADKKVNTPSEKSENSSAPRFSLRSGGRLSAADRAKRDADPRWQVAEALKGILGREDVLSPRLQFRDAIADWGRVPDSAKGDEGRSKDWEHRWLRAEGAFRTWCTENDHLLAGLGFGEATDANSDSVDEFDPHDVIYAIPGWLNEIEAGRYQSESEEDDPLALGRRDAAFRSVTEGMSPHEAAALDWDGHYDFPDLMEWNIDALGQQKMLRDGNDTVFTNGGEVFTARRNSSGGWTVEDAYGHSEDLEPMSKVWIDREQDHQVARENRERGIGMEPPTEKELEAAIKKAEAEVKKAEAKKAEAEARRTEAAAELAKAALAEREKSSEAARERKRAAEADAEKAKADAEKASAELELKRVEVERIKAASKARAGDVKRARRDEVKELVKALAREMFRISAIRGKRASTMDYESNRAIANVIENLAQFDGKLRKLINYFQGKAVEDIRVNPDENDLGNLVKYGDDITKWREERGAYPKFLWKRVEDAFQNEAVALLSRKEVSELLKFIEGTKRQGRMSRDRMMLERAAEREKTAREMLTAMGMVEKTHTGQKLSESEKKEGKFMLDLRGEHVIREEKEGRSAVAKAADAAWNDGVRRGVSWATRPETVVRILDGTAGRESEFGPWEENLFDPMRDSYNAEKVAMTRLNVKLTRILSKLVPMKKQREELTDGLIHKVVKDLSGKLKDGDGKNLKATLMTKDGDLFKKEITIGAAMTIYAYSKNESGRAHLEGSGYITEESGLDGWRDSVHKIAEALPQKYKDAVDEIMEYFDNDQYERMNPVYRREHFIDMPKEKNYWPIRGLKLSGKQTSMEAENNFRAGVAKGMTKGRINSAAEFKELDFFGILVPALEEAEHYIAFNDAVRETGRLLNHKTVSMALEQRHPRMKRALEQFLKTAAQGTEPTQDDPLTNGLMAIKRNYTVAALGINLLTMMKQLDSIVQATVRVKGGYYRVPMAFLERMNPAVWGERDKFIMGKSAFMRHRAQSVEAKLDELVKSKGLMGTVREKSMYFTQGADMAVVKTAWLAQYEVEYNRVFAGEYKKALAEVGAGGGGDYIIGAGGESQSTGRGEVINKQFNEELQKQIEGTLPVGHVYNLGHPDEILRSAGVDDLPIQLAARRLKIKSEETYGHPFDLSEIKDLPRAINEPIAVFAYGDKSKAINIITRIEKGGKQFLVGVSLNPEVDGAKLGVNSIRTVFPKDMGEWVNWISQDKALYIDKEKVSELLANPRNPEDVTNNPTLIKKLQTFKNPAGVFIKTATERGTPSTNNNIQYADEKIKSQVKKVSSTPADLAHARAAAIADEAAVKAADRLIRRTQPEFGKLYQAEALRGNTMPSRLFAMFLTQQNQNLNNAIEIIYGARIRARRMTLAGATKEYCNAVGQLVGQVMLPSAVFRTLSVGKLGLFGALASGMMGIARWLAGDDPEKDFAKAADYADEWEDYIDVLAEYTFGGIPLIGLLPVGATRAGTNMIREARGREKKRGGYVGASPVINALNDISKVVYGESSWLDLGLTATQLAGVPGGIQARRLAKSAFGDDPWEAVKAAAEDKDPAWMLWEAFKENNDLPLGAVWSKRLREDTGVNAAMMKREAGGVSGKEWDKFSEWYDSMDDKGKNRFQEYFNDELNKRVAKNEKKEFDIWYRELSKPTWTGIWARERYEEAEESDEAKIERFDEWFYNKMAANATRAAKRAEKRGRHYEETGGDFERVLRHDRELRAVLGMPEEGED